MLHKTKGIALHYIKYGDSSIIAHIYTDVFGRQAYIVNGVRSKKSKIRLSLFQPLSVLDMDVYYKPGREIQRIKELRSYLLLRTIHSDITKSSMAIFISEVIYKTLREVEANRPLFDFLINSIHILDTTEKGIENFHLVFMLMLSKYIGISPQITGNKKAEKTEGGIKAELSDNLQNSFLMSDEELGGLEELYKYSYEDLGKIRISNNTRSSLLNKLVDYYRIHLEGIGSIKSLEVLKEVFNM